MLVVGKDLATCGPVLPILSLPWILVCTKLSTSKTDFMSINGEKALLKRKVKTVVSVEPPA